MSGRQFNVQSAEQQALYNQAHLSQPRIVAPFQPDGLNIAASSSQHVNLI